MNALLHPVPPERHEIDAPAAPSGGVHEHGHSHGHSHGHAHDGHGHHHHEPAPRSGPSGFSLISLSGWARLGLVLPLLALLWLLTLWAMTHG